MPKGSKSAKPVDKVFGKVGSPETKRYSGVEFWIVGDDSVTTERGTVLIREREMVLEVSDGEGGIYLLPGRLNGHYYSAIEQRPQGGEPVRAKWSRLGAHYVGIWREKNFEYLFRFRPDEPNE